MNNEYMILKVKKVNSCSECELYVCCNTVPYDFDKNKKHPQCPLQDTTELFEALEEIKRYASDNSVKVRIAYNKLYKALGGNVDE